jgi:endonuclease/exonuclease/phosphatase family metal-dependent hydrolase
MSRVRVRLRRAAVLTIVVIAAWLTFGRRHTDAPASPPPLRMATFNIENYPASDRQEVGAFAAIRDTHAPLVAVQEITDPVRFRRVLRRTLGTSWSTAFVALEDRSLHAVGLAFDRRAVRLAWARTNRATVIYPGARPTLEARLYRRNSNNANNANRTRHSNNPALRVFVVHLKAGGDSTDMRTRTRQLDALAPSLAAARADGDDVYVLGDFNTTGDADRANLERISRSAGLTWASRDLPCTAYWDRDDGCRGSALDHVLTAHPPRDIFAADPCRREGCAVRDTCPTFVHDVSDHCPVVVDLR